MKCLPLLTLLLLATPVAAQSRLYTNADVGRPVSPDRVTVTAAQLASLEAHQFHTPDLGDGPTVVFGSPAAEEQLLPWRPADALWPVVTYGRYGGYGYGAGRRSTTPWGVHGGRRIAGSAGFVSSGMRTRPALTPAVRLSPRVSASPGGVVPGLVIPRIRNVR